MVEPCHRGYVKAVGAADSLAASTSPLQMDEARRRVRGVVHESR